jgi:hypothetical protein
MPVSFFAYLETLCCQYKKTACVIGVFFILLLFGDTLLPLIGHFLHLLVEVIESALEHFLEAVFGFSARQAQIILFYSFCIIIGYSAWYVTRKIYFAALQGYEVARTFWRSPKVKAWIKTLLVFSALGTTVYIFS